MKRTTVTALLLCAAVACYAAEPPASNTSTARRKATRTKSRTEKPTAAKTATELAPIVDYRPRYVQTDFDGSTVSFLDTATGRVVFGQRFSSGIDTWRAYDLNKIAKKKGMFPLSLDKTYENRLVNQRYEMSAVGPTVIFLDTLTGRVWTCRHSKGLLDTWKCYDTQELMKIER